MTVHWNHNAASFECDSCDEILDTNEDEFAAAWSKARDAGWRSKKIGTEWVHGCPGCGV